MKKYIKGIAAALFACAILVFAFWWGGDSPSLHGFEVKEKEAVPTKAEVVEETESVSVSSGEVIEPKKEEKEEKEEEPVREAQQKANTCFVSVRCDTILKNADYANSSVLAIVPQNGEILPRKETVLTDGESVFDVLVRETRNSGIHLEFVKAPVNNSAYIEGIANIYEFDCGELSGWMYKVNGVFPKVSCSEYILKAGDEVEWVYTCDSGEDVGAKKE